jgi:hypothetical protein
LALIIQVLSSAVNTLSAEYTANKADMDRLVTRLRDVTHTIQQGVLPAPISLICFVVLLCETAVHFLIFPQAFPFFEIKVDLPRPEKGTWRRAS